MTDTQGVLPPPDDVDPDAEKHYLDTMGRIPPSLADLASVSPQAFRGYTELRKWLLRDDDEAALPKRYRHLVFVALDCANGNLSGALNHTRAAMRSGLTADEAADAMVGLIIARGTPAWGQFGRHVVALAREIESGGDAD